MSRNRYGFDEEVVILMTVRLSLLSVQFLLDARLLFDRRELPDYTPMPLLDLRNMLQTRMSLESGRQNSNK